MPQTNKKTNARTNEKTSKLTEGYSSLARVLHWLVASGIVLQYLLGKRAEEAAEDGAKILQLSSLAQHKSIGITVLVLVIARIAWRARTSPPPLPESVRQASPTLAMLSHWMHFALYGLLLFLPLSGWLMSSASAYSVSWFGLFTLPDLIGPSDAAKGWLQSTHHFASKLLFVLAVLHIVAAFKHLFIDKSGVMGRMASTATVAVFGASLLIGVWFTWPASDVRAAPAAANTPTAGSEAEVLVSTEPAESRTTTANQIAQVTRPGSNAGNAPEPWKIDYSKSVIEFTAVQAGAEFDGQWQRFNADIRFSTTDLDRSSASVRIDATSVATKDAERDDTLAGADWFNSRVFSDVIFTAESFTRVSQNTFTSAAKLRIKDATYPVKFNFSVQANDVSRTLRGTAKLDRLALNLGAVEWADTEWVGQYVDVSVTVVAQVTKQSDP